MARSAKFMFGSIRLATVATMAVAIVTATGLAIPQAQAGLDEGDAANFGWICQCGNLLFTNSNVTGNIGIGDTGVFVGTGSGTITGAVEFNGPDTEITRFRPDGIAVNGGAIFNSPIVQSSLNALNTLSQSLRNEGGTSTQIVAGGSLSASDGILDSNGNEIFTATIGSTFIPGTAFTINGTSGQFVVVNITTGGLRFDGSIVLAGGITSDNVLLNFDAGNFDTQSGGDPLLMDTDGNLTTGTFLDPNGQIQIVNSVIDGRIFGGDSVDFVISGSTLVAPVAPPPSPASEPTSLTLLGAGLVAFGMIRRRHRPLA